MAIIMSVGKRELLSDLFQNVIQSFIRRMNRCKKSNKLVSICLILAAKVIFLCN